MPPTTLNSEEPHYLHLYFSHRNHLDCLAK